MRSVGRSSVFLGIVLLATSGLAACASGVEGSPPSERSSDAPLPPEFSGPFAAEYTQAWEESDSEFVRQVLADERVSEQEWAEVESRMKTCFSDAGATFEGHTPDGGYAAQRNELSSERMEEVMALCETSSGEHPIGFLWFGAQKNPENVPPEIAVTECMIRNDVVAPDYTPEQFVEDNPTMSFPYLDPASGQEGFLACNNDPRTGL